MSFTTDDQFNQNMATLLGNNYVDDLKQRGYITAQIIKHRHEKKMIRKKNESTGNSKSNRYISIDYRPTGSRPYAAKLSNFIGYFQSVRYPVNDRCKV